MLRFQARLARLLPRCALHHFSGALLEPGGVPQGARVAPLVANAAVWDDQFGWHRDAQPAEASAESPWAARFGLHSNREPGRPRLVSAVVYLNDEWPPEWDADTLFADPPSGGGLLVRAVPGRVTLMDQDVLHRLSAPARAAGRPRYSLVWKLALWPLDGEAENGLRFETPPLLMPPAGKEGGGGGARPAMIGSAAELVPDGWVG